MKSIYLVLLLYYSPYNELFFKIIKIVSTPKGSISETIRIISVERKDEQGNKIDTKEYESFRMEHQQDEFIVLGKIDVSEEYYKTIKANL